MNAGAWVGLVRDDRVRSATLAQIEPFWSLEHANRLDRVHPVRRQPRVAGARAVVDPFEPCANSRFSRSPRFRCGSCSSFTTCSSTTGTTRACRTISALRQFGYAWSFATIWPAIFEAADLIDVWRARPARNRPPCRSRHSRPLCRSDRRQHSGGRTRCFSGRWCGRRRYLAAPVWLGFILLFDPINDGSVRNRSSATLAAAPTTAWST